MPRPADDQDDLSPQPFASSSSDQVGQVARWTFLLRDHLGDQDRVGLQLDGLGDQLSLGTWPPRLWASIPWYLLQAVWPLYPFMFMMASMPTVCASVPCRRRRRRPSARSSPMNSLTSRSSSSLHSDLGDGECAG